VKDGIAAIVTIIPYTYMLARSTLDRNLGEGLLHLGVAREMLLPLFTKLPRRVLLGNRASGIVS
jgi:hypothetical protein